MSRKIRTTRNYLRRILVRTIVATLVLAFLPLLIIAVVQGLTTARNDMYDLNAESFLAEHASDVDVSDAVEDGWSATIVDGELHVTQLGGDELFEQGDLSAEEWTVFLRSTGEVSRYVYEVAYSDGDDGYWLVFRKPRAVTFAWVLYFNREAQGFNSTLVLFAAIFSVYFVALLLFVVLYSRRAARTVTESVEKVSDGAKSIERGDYEINLEPCGTAELDDLGKAVNRLARELKSKDELKKKEEEKRMLLVSELSHDLKTPLASVQGYSEMLLRGVKDEKTREEYLQLIHSNSVRANSILQSLFMYSKLGSDGYEPSREPKDICEFIRQIMAEYVPRFEDKGFAYELGVPEEEIVISMNKELLRRVFDNLLENSMKYNEPGTKITLKVSKENGKVKIAVSDNGVGIPDEYADKIFTPFYRADNREGGSGLGLAIVKRIVELHEGEIAYISDGEPGCRFLIDIPAK